MGHKYWCYQKKIKALMDEADVMGVVLVGKGALADEATFETLNDVDLIVLTSSGVKNRRSVALIEGVEFDMSYLPISFVENAIHQRDILWIEILANSKIVYSLGIDPLIDQCKDIWEKGPTLLRSIDKAYFSFYLTTSLNDIKNRLKDEALAKYLITEFLTGVMRLTFRLHRKFEPLKKKRWIGQIKSLDNSLGHQIEEILMITSVDEQYKAVESLYNEVTKTLGGVVSTWTDEEFPEKIMEVHHE